MFGFIKKSVFYRISIFIKCKFVNYNSSMNNQECKVRPEIVNGNSDVPVFSPFSIKTSKCSGSCN